MKKSGRQKSGHSKKYNRGYQCGFQRVRREIVDNRKPRPRSDAHKSQEERGGIKDGEKAARRRYKK